MSNRSDGRPATLTRALRSFLATEVAGGVALAAAAVIALAWANSPWSDSYHDLWATQFAVRLGSHDLSLDLHGWVNDGLMAVFFLVVGLEIKRELLEGELRDHRQAALPVVAAIGGMVVPAVIFIAFNAGGGGARGWGIPMATDIAFALGVLAVIGRGLPSSLRLFLLALAIVDDLGAILVIAVFYSDGLQTEWLVAALGLLAAALVIRRVGIQSTGLFALMGVGLWLVVHESGLHATIAGVVMGFLAPARAGIDRELVVSRRDELLDVFSPEAAHTTSRLARLSVSQMEWLEHALHPWTSFVIVPVFALANAGVEVSRASIDAASTSPVTWGIIAGLVVGKTVGITSFAWLGCRLGFAALPSGTRWRQIIGVALLGGIGFTVSLFVTELAFDQHTITEEAKMGILVAAILAPLLAAVVLRRSRGIPQDDPPARAV